MAKRIPGGMIQFECDFTGTDYKLRFFSYDDPDDSIDATILYKKTGTEAVGSGPRDLTAGELSGTLQAFIDACHQAAKDAEGVS